MDIEKEKLVILDEDKKAIALKELLKMYHTSGELHNQLKNDALTEEMKNTLFELIESYTSDASKALNYNSHATKKILERYADIRKANQRIKELEKMLTDNTQTSGLKELLYEMHDTLNEWWEQQGFNLVTDDMFGGYGYKGRFCLDTSHISFESTRPITRAKEHQSHLEYMIEEGYEFIKEDGNGYVLLDTQKNRELITKLAKGKIPSLKITKWENWCLRKEEDFKLRSFECYISDLNDIKTLNDEIRQRES